MNWKAFISNLDSLNLLTSFQFNSPATDNELKELQDSFKLNELPEELVGLYKQSNGIEEYLDNVKIGELIWPINRVIETNKEFRDSPHFKDLYMSFEQLLFVADAGNGDLFGFITLNGNFDRNDIFVWNHENDSREWVEPSLEKFIEWWLNGTIKI
ncbi:SMI1/KNR4 family protein [Emticicia agri]|uniref:SMI1/KNR4 family protein n=1 Tax=Emticicia agri TaxID=2492393 RepID=A0A4Q5LT47_9BACT|nr:SMI1/KNR4 family protein [Emticicia agri]RYU92724.1 SMI1/KNR4 family protein [Emticicia agri]